MKYMRSKFYSTCKHCGDTIAAGEKIAHLGKGHAEHIACYERRTEYDQAKASSESAGNDWADALSWSGEPDSKPAKNESPTNQPSGPQPKVSGATQIGPAVDRTIAKSIDAPPAVIDVFRRRDLETESIGERTDKIAQRVVGIDKSRQLPLDPHTRVVADLVVSLVNAVQSLDVEQRSALSATLAGFAENASSPGRADIWSRVKNIA